MEEENQQFTTSFSKDASWQPGLRTFFEYRDLGIDQATGGTFNAHVIRVKKPVEASPILDRTFMNSTFRCFMS
jgi:hypothetical protein